jgi:hypothetical protein
LGVLLPAIMLLLILTSLSGHKVIWLTPAEFARSTQPGPFSALKQKIKILAAPVWQRFRRAPLQIRIETSIVTLAASAARDVGLGRPVSTNVNGMSVWILSAAELNTLQARLKTNPAALLRAMPVQTLNRWPAQLGETMPGLWGKPPTALTLGLIPKAASGSIKLTASVIHTTLSTQPPAPTFVVKTNLTAACRAVIPAGHGLVMKATNLQDPIADTYFFLFSPAVLDAQGNPIKPR